MKVRSLGSVRKRMSRKGLVIAGALAVVAIAAGAARTTGRRSTPTSAQAATGQGSSVGRQRRWKLTLEARLENPDTKAPGAVKSTLITGDWITTVSGGSESGYEVACEIDHPHATGSGFNDVSADDLASLEKRLASRFWVAYRPDGAAVRAFFPRDMQDDIRNFLQLVVTQTQLVWSPQQASQWTATERDSAGTYFAVYRRRAPGELIKKKLEYIAVDGAAEGSGASLGVTVDASETRILVDDAQNILTLDSQEKLHLSAMSGMPAFGIDMHVSLGGPVVTTTATALVGSLDRVRSSLESMPIVTHRPGDKEALARRDARLVQGSSWEAIIAPLRDTPTDEATVARLEAWLRQHAQDAAKAKDLAGANDDALARTVLSSLGVAGTPEAQAALCALALDQSAAKERRRLAMEALVRTSEPTAATFSTLVRLLDDREPRIRRQALFMAGTVARLGYAAHAKEASQVESLLLDRFSSCSGAACADLMVALGNLGTSKVMSAIERGLRPDESSTVRAEAARSLRLVRDPAADQRLAALIQEDRAPAVREAAIFASGFRPLAPLLEPLVRAVTDDAVDYVRIAAIGALGGHLAESPRIEQALVLAARSDPQPSVRSVARQTLGARFPTQDDPPEGSSRKQRPGAE